MIVREGSYWCIVSKDGQTKFGCYDTEAEAKERLRQVEAAKHANDSVRRIDFLQRIVFVDAADARAPSDAIAARLTPEGYLRIEGNISSVGVYDYRDAEGNEWSELRLPEHVFAQASLDSFKLKPITDDHPEDFVTADTWAELAKGHLGSNIRPDAAMRHVVADMLITDPVLIDKIRNGKTQLSNGYQTVLVEQSGVVDGSLATVLGDSALEGREFRRIQTQIQGNHNSVVDEARGGPTCALLLDHKDTAIRINRRSTMKTIKAKTKDGRDVVLTVERTKDSKPIDATMTIGDQTYEMPDDVAMAWVQSLQAPEGGEQPGAPAMPAPQMAAPVPLILQSAAADPVKDKTAATIDTLQTQLEMERQNRSRYIDARVKLTTDARKVLGESFVTDGLEDLDIMRQIVTKVNGKDSKPSLTVNAKDESGKYLASADYVRSAYDCALEIHADANDTGVLLMRKTFNATNIKDDEKEFIENFIANA